MWHFGSGVGHINNTVVRSQAVDVLSDMDVDSEEEAVGDSIYDSDLPQVDVVARAELDTDEPEKDEEMADSDSVSGTDEDLQLDLDLDEQLNDEEDMGSDDDGYASL
jgi:hypothetical protein